MSRVLGFTLMEIMVAVIMIGILAALALPSYMTYVKGAKYAEVVFGANAVKQQVMDCATALNTLTGCIQNTNGINADVANPTPNISQINTAANGVITMTGNSAVFGSAYTYILTPTYSASFGVTWVKSGTCVAAALCN